MYRPRKSLGSRTCLTVYLDMGGQHARHTLETRLAIRRAPNIEKNPIANPRLMFIIGGAKKRLGPPALS